MFERKREREVPPTVPGLEQKVRNTIQVSQDGSQSPDKWAIITAQGLSDRKLESGAGAKYHSWWIQFYLFFKRKSLTSFKDKFEIDLRFGYTELYLLWNKLNGSVWLTFTKYTQTVNTLSTSCTKKYFVCKHIL